MNASKNWGPPPVLLFRSVHAHTPQRISGWAAFRYALLNWALSRVVVFVSIFILAPHVPLPEDPDFRPSLSWSQMNLWDGTWYEKIATQGYEYQPDRREHNIVFFPLYPGLVWVLMRTGLGFPAAGTIVSNIAFLGALYLLYQRTAEHYGDFAARWAVAAMAWFPLSVFCSATYSEAVFLLLTLAFFQAFEKEYYWLATLFAGLVAICRVPGVTIVPTILIIAYFGRLPWRAYMPAMSACLGLSIFMAYQGIRFHDALAFVHDQAHWPHPPIAEVLSHFYLPNSLLRIVTVPAAMLLLWSVRRKLCNLDLLYAAFTFLLILYSLHLASADRFVLGVSSVFIAAGMWLSQRPRLAATAIVVSGLALSFESLKWAWNHFLA